MKRFDWRLATAFTFLLMLLLANAFFANRSLQGLVDAQQLIGHTWQVRLTVRDTQTHFERSVASIRGYFYLNDTTMLAIWKQARRDLLDDLDKLDDLLRDNPDQATNVAEMRVTLEKHFRIIDENLVKKKRLGAAWKPDPSQVSHSKALLENVRNVQKKMDIAESLLATQRNERVTQNERQTQLTIFGATAMACLALVATFVLIRQMLQERLLAERAIRRANLDLERRVTERTESLQNANDRLHTLNKEPEALSYTVSHDLRAPLRHVVGFADLLEKKSGKLLDESGRRYLALVNDAGRRAGTLIDDLLSFSRMSRSELNQSLVPMTPKVERIAGELRAENPQRQIHWDIQPLPEVWGDAAMLRLVWRNLLENAIKYSGTKPTSEIQIGVRQSAKEWEFFVRDNGVGFDMAHAQKLFGVFQRLHDAETFEGTGIGLANVRRIVARHGGRTWAESEPDRGATFYFSLPRERREESPQEPA